MAPSVGCSQGVSRAGSDATSVATRATSAPPPLLPLPLPGASASVASSSASAVSTARCRQLTSAALQPSSRMLVHPPPSVEAASRASAAASSSACSALPARSQRWPRQRWWPHVTTAPTPTVCGAAETARAATHSSGPCAGRGPTMTAVGVSSRCGRGLARRSSSSAHSPAASAEAKERMRAPGRPMAHAHAGHERSITQRPPSTIAYTVETDI